jgi:hypothetical protein
LVLLAFEVGAGEGNRTIVSALGRPDFNIKDSCADEEMDYDHLKAPVGTKVLRGSGSFGG